MKVSYKSLIIRYFSDKRNDRMEEDLIVISMKLKKNVVNEFIDLTKSETVEQKDTVFTVPPSDSGRKKSKTKKK